MGELKAIGLALDLWQNAYKQRLQLYGVAVDNVAPSLSSSSKRVRLKRSQTAIAIDGTLPNGHVSILQSAPLRILTDSQYCIGVLTKYWKVVKNVELVNELKSRIKEVKLILGHSSKVSLHWVKGHAGVPGMYGCCLHLSPVLCLI
jgi:hypothetical protein